MSKIKLLILSLTSLIVIACVKKTESIHKFNVGYISGGPDGLYFNNLLTSNLKTFDLYEAKSNLTIEASLTHSNSVFITNINNTSDREKISSTINVSIKNIDQDCIIYKYDDEIAQFFVISSNINYVSNNAAVKEIKNSNTEELTTKLINKINSIKNIDCLETIKY